MKKEVSPAVMWATLAIVGIAVIVIGYRMLVPSTKMDTKGSEADIARVQKGETFYQPPANAPIPRPGSAAGNNAPGGGTGYNLTPPSH